MCSTSDNTDCVSVQKFLIDGDSDPILTFGPLSCSLSELFSQGFFLRAICYNYKRRIQYSEKVHLVRGQEKYLVGKVPRSWFGDPKGQSLSTFVTNTNYLQKHSVDYRDPLEQLLLEFPVKRVKKDANKILVGNQTLKEYVRSL